MRCNGKELALGKNVILSDFLKEQGYESARVAVEVNLKIIPKEEYGRLELKEDDAVEVVSFMGGGSR